jgi:hypothetical protein
LERNHYNGLKAIHVNFGVRKFVVVDLDAEIPLNLLLKTRFHSIVTTKFVPPNLKGDPPKPPQRWYNKSCATYSTLS